MPRRKIEKKIEKKPSVEIVKLSKGEIKITETTKEEFEKFKTAKENQDKPLIKLIKTVAIEKKTVKVEGSPKILKPLIMLIIRYGLRHGLKIKYKADFKRGVVYLTPEE